MKLFRMKSLVAGGAIALAFASAKEGKSRLAGNRSPPRGNADGFQNELKIYLLNTPLRPSIGLDLMEPSSAATAESNKQVLLDVLGDAEMLEALERAKRQTCTQLQSTTCPEHWKTISCDTINMTELRRILIQADSQINSAEGASAACPDALRHGLILFDILVISDPLKVFQRNPSAGTRHALNNLFSTLNMASMGGVKQDQQQSTEAATPTMSSHINAEQFIEIKSLLVGYPRITCDLMLQAAFALHLAEMYAIERMNNLQQVLPPQGLESSLPLELYAGGRINLQRLCAGFRAPHGGAVLLDTPCSYDDTVLASLQASAEKSSAAATEETSLLESVPIEQEQRNAPSRRAGRNAESDFLLLQLRGGNRQAIAHLLGNDNGPWSALCRKVVKKLGSKAASANEESNLCSSTWRKDVWDKRLHCQSKLVTLQCAALESFFGVLDNDGADNIFRNFAALVSERATSVLFSRWLPLTVRRLMKKYLGRKYSRRHFRFLSSKLPYGFYMKLRSCIEVLVHPSVFVHLNQLAFTGSELSGARSRAGGLSERLDSVIAETATEGLPQRLKKKLQAGESASMTDYSGINFAHVHPPKPKTWQEYLKLELESSLTNWLMQPSSRDRIEHECRGGRGSNIVAVFRDSLDLLRSSDAENLTLIGKVVSPSETSVGKPLRLKSLFNKLLRLPTYKTQHHSFVAINVQIPEALKLVRTLVEVFTQNQGVFENQEVFMTAVVDLFAHFEAKNTVTSGGPLGVPRSVLVPPLHRYYASLPKADRLKHLKDSAMQHFFRHIWTLIFSVSANNILNAGSLDGLEKTFSDEAWQVSINDPFQASDIVLELIHRKSFTWLGMFLHAQSVYFGLMIQQWIQKRTEDRVREIISWLSLGLFFASSLVQVTEGVTQVANTGNETGQASMTTGCPPIGLCMDDNGNAFVGNPTGSPALTALQAVMKAGIMASIAVLAGPLIALYNIAVSQFRILSRLEMALGNTCKQLVSKLSKSKAVTNIKELFATKQDKKKLREAAAAKKAASLGDEVEQSLTAFFQEHEQQRCQR
ncbi:hypothetical protein, conserved [Eimeria brunetti]|uniref:Chromosome III, complete sequence, related n=1 Tax=Eimeria brunetti TaxID=51314 RepID=U6LQM7_9EIME|nr:hypothetical protein, conserved [Eimeria brunetti]